MTTTKNRTAEELYAEYQEWKNRPLVTPYDWRNPSEEYYAKHKMLKSLWSTYAATNELECLTLREVGEKKRAIRQERLFDVRERVRKDLTYEITAKVAVGEWGMGDDRALTELLTLPTYRQALAQYDGTPDEVLEEFFTELRRAKRYDDDLFANLCRNYALSTEHLDRLIKLARTPENYRLLVEHPNLTADQFARIAIKAPNTALLREAGLLYRWEGSRNTSPYEVIPTPALPLPSKVLTRVMNAAVRSGSRSAQMMVFLDDRSTIAMKRRALTEALPGRVVASDGTVGWLSTLRERLAALDAQRVARLDAEARVMLWLYPRTPKRVLNLIAQSGIRSDEVMSGAKYPKRTVLYPAYFIKEGRATSGV